MSNINKIAELISQKKGNPLKDILYNKIENSVNVGKYLRNNDIPRENVGHLGVNSFDDAINYGKMGLNNYAHDLAGFIEDPSSIKDAFNTLRGDPEAFISKRRMDEAKAGASSSVLLAALLANLLSEENPEEDYYNFEDIE